VPSSRTARFSTKLWTCTTIPTVQEILIVHSTAIRAESLRWDTAGNGPEQATMIETGQLDLRSIDFTVDLLALYRGARLVQG
jgi:hypothetical protein